MKIYIGADHNGYQLKADLAKHLEGRGYEVEDDGDERLDPEDDFPIFAGRVAAKVLSSDDDDPRGILICGSGQGMSMVANRFKGIRAAVVWDKTEASYARNDDNSNVPALPARVIGMDRAKAYDIVETWLKTPFESIPRRVRRIKQMDELT